MLEDKSGDGHATEILRSLNGSGIDVEKLHFHSYDFTVCMLNEKIQKGFPGKVIGYIPCQVHQLNTHLSSKLAKLIPSCHQFFTVLQLIYSGFFQTALSSLNHSRKHQRTSKGQSLDFVRAYSAFASKNCRQRAEVRHESQD